jgi:hypothetical protein
MAQDTLVRSVGEVRSLADRLRTEGADEMFVQALDNLVDQWEPVAAAEWS